MVSAVHCQLNPQVRLFVPTAMTSKLAYSTIQYSTAAESERKERSLCGSTRFAGDGRWTGRRGVGRLNPRRENKCQGKNGDRERGKIKKSQRRGKFWRVNGGGEVEQRGAAYDRAKGVIEHVREDGRSQLPRTTSGRWRWIGRTELDGRWMF